MILMAYDAPMNPWGPAIDQLHPYKGTLSGEKEYQKPSYNYGPPSAKYPVLALEDDIVDDAGRGLKKGFYEIRPDKGWDFFLFIQSGKIKAKIPIISVENLKNNPSEKTKAEKISPKKQAKLDRKAQKQAQKQEKKYRKGENPANIVHSEVKMFYDKKTGSRIIIYEFENIKAIGCLKL